MNRILLLLCALWLSMSVGLAQDNGRCLPPVAIGDIVCTDGSIVKPGDWPCGKTAKGIVFYVDSTGEHGWIVHLQNQTSGTGSMWSNNLTNNNVNDLNNYGNARAAIADLDGLGNTRTIRAAGNDIIFPAAWAVDFVNGWYLPAAGQLNVLYGNLIEVNRSLGIVGGTAFEMNGNFGAWEYWSSSQSTRTGGFLTGYRSGAWFLDNQGELDYDNKTYSKSVRSVADF